MTWIVTGVCGLFSGCVGETAAELYVYVSLDGGDLFLLSGFEAEGCSSGLSWKVGYSFVGRGWIGVVQVELVVVVLN